MRELFPKECLHFEYGGTVGKFDDVSQRFNDSLVNNSKWIQTTEGLKVTGKIPDYMKTFNIVGETVN